MKRFGRGGKRAGPQKHPIDKLLNAAGFPHSTFTPQSCGAKECRAATIRWVGQLHDSSTLASEPVHEKSGLRYMIGNGSVRGRRRRDKLCLLFCFVRMIINKKMLKKNNVY